MIPNTYRWLQSVCLPLPPTKHLNSRTLWWVEGWKALLHVFLLRHTPSSPLSLFSILSLHLFPSPIKKLFSSLLCFVDWLPATDPAFILFYFYLSGLIRFPRSSSVPIPPIFVPVGFAQRYVCLFLRGSEWCVCRPSWQREQQSLTWTYAVRAPIYNYFL